jgi:ribosome maturation factor RimP
MPHIDSQDLASRIRALAEEAAAEAGLFVVDVQVRGHQGARMVEVFVDSEEGAGIDAIAATSRQLGFLLDTEDLVKGRYQLNVSSPGADRPLTEPRQFPRHVGRTLEVLRGPEDARERASGTLLRVSEEGIELEIDGEPAEIAFADLAEARVKLPW